MKLKLKLWCSSVFILLVSVATHSKAQDCSCLTAEIVCSNPTSGMVVCLL